MKHLSKWLFAGFLLVGLGGGAYLWWQHGQGVAPVPEPAPVAAAPSVTEPTPPAKPLIRHPIEALQPSLPELAGLPAVGDSGNLVKDALIVRDP